MLDFSAPQSALMMERRIEPLTYDPETQGEPTYDEFSAVAEKLRDITLALTVLGPRSVIPAIQWFSFDDPDFEYAQMGTSRRSQMLEILPNKRRTYPGLDPIEAPKVVQGYLALKGGTRDKVRVALERLRTYP